MQAGALGSTMRGIGKWLGMSGEEQEQRSALDPTDPPMPRLALAAMSRAEEAAAELDRYRAILANVSAFLLEHAIEPLPEHYDLAYRHRIAGEPGLGTIIAQLIRDGHMRLDAISKDETALTVSLLATLVDQAQKQLVDVVELTRQSGEDARAYGRALEENVAELAPAIANHPVLGSLVGLTQMMIEKTSAVERRMRESAVQMDTMRENLDQAREQADTDALTGLSNRRAFERALGAAAERATRDQTPLTLAFCDIDCFKAVNDNHGHDVGDRVLTFVGRILKEHVGRRGTVSRHGGEEFVLMFEGIGADETWDIVDAARHDLFRRNIIDRNGGQPIGSISFSAGVATLGPDGNISVMLRQADRALYRAKRAGRNQVLMADPVVDDSHPGGGTA